MSHELFMDLSDEQQELVSGGGDVFAADLGLALFNFSTSTNSITQIENVSAGMNGANAVGGQTVTEVDTEVESAAAKLLLGGTQGQGGNAGTAFDGGLGSLGSILG